LHPLLRVDLEEQVSEAVVTSLREGRADIGVFVEGPDIAGLSARVFRNDQLVLVLPRGHRLAGARTPLPFSEALDEDWIGLNPGAAMLQKQQQAALAAGKPLRLRMQVRSFDAVCHLVASGLGIAVLPAAAALPIVRAVKLTSRPLADEWARRRLLVATVTGRDDASVASLVNFMIEPSPTAKPRPRKR
jgi:DNA-binding transcriptional LysR family regulator